MFSRFLKPVLQSLLALTLVAALFHGVPLLLGHPADDTAATEAQGAADTASEDEESIEDPRDEQARAASQAISDWRPDVDQVIDQLEEILVTDLPQQQMNYTMANLAMLYDTKLYLTFIDYLAALEPDDVGQALAEQQKWLQKRKAVTASAHEEYAGGSLASYNAGEAYLHVTRDRLDELSGRLAAH